MSCFEVAFAELRVGEQRLQQGSFVLRVARHALFKVASIGSSQPVINPVVIVVRVDKHAEFLILRVYITALRQRSRRAVVAIRLVRVPPHAHAHQRLERFGGERDGGLRRSGMAFATAHRLLRRPHLPCTTRNRHNRGDRRHSREHRGGAPTSSCSRRVRRSTITSPQQRRLLVHVGGHDYCFPREVNETDRQV